MPGLRILLIILCACMAAPAMAGERAALPSISVEGQAELSKAPDMVKITIGVRSQAPQAQEAASQNAARMNQVIQALKSKLGPKDRMQTTGYNLYARQKWDPKKKQNVHLGFEASNQVLVTSRNIKGASALIDAALQAGANNIHGISFGLSQAGAVKRQVQALAFADAKAQAEALATEAGMSLGKVLSISTTGKSVRHEAYSTAPKLRMAVAPTPVEPGQVDFSAAVHCVFSLEKP